MLTKVVENERDHSLFILSHGIQMSLNSYSYEKIMVLKKTGHVTCSTLFGYQIYLWKESKLMVIGLWCVQTNVLGFLNVGAINLKNFTHNTSNREEEERQLRHNGFGIRLLILKLKLEHHICYTKTTATRNQTSKIWERLKAQIFARKLSSTLIKTK